MSAGWLESLRIQMKEISAELAAQDAVHERDELRRRYRMRRSRAALAAGQLEVSVDGVLDMVRGGA